MLNQSLIDSIEGVMRECGDIMLNADRSEIGVESKAGDANFVTKYDTMIQEILKKKLLEILPEAGFVGEEKDEAFCADREYVYIVDPIDGTTNFIKDYHQSCISVALRKEKKGYLGMIYNPYVDEFFYAQRGEGAFVNGRQIHVSEEPLANGIVIFGTAPYYKELNQPTFDMAYSYFQKALDVRRGGSAALDLCAIAAGRAELFFELCLSPWDYAAGALIIEEAGGIVTTVEGDALPYDKKCSVIATNRIVRGEIET